MTSTTTLLRRAAAMLVAAGFYTGASAQILLQDNFDGYLDQAAFQAAWPAVGTTASGTLDSTLSVSAPNSIKYATTAQRNERSFAESGTPSVSLNNIIRLSIDFYDSDATLNPYRQYVTLQDGTAPSGAAQLIGLGLNNNLTSALDGGNYYMARILGYTPPGSSSGAFFKLNDPGAPLRSTGWHSLAVEISDVDFKFYVDGVLSEVVANTFALRSYDVVRLGSGLSSTATANFDNVKVEIVPEPSSMVFCLIGGAALLRGRRRRQDSIS